jgi:hypothetical protein
MLKSFVNYHIPSHNRRDFLFYNVFIGMSEVSLKKLLTTVLKEKYPGIERIEVRANDNNMLFGPRIEYTIYIGMGYSEMEKVNTEEIKREAKEYSKYVLKAPLEVIYSVVFFDPYY